MAVSIKAGKITGRLLAKALVAVVRKIKNPKIKHGKQSVKSLARQGAGLQNIEITDTNIKSFERTARKYGVDFALKKDAAEEPPRWVVFFKAKDSETLTAAFQEFSARTLGRKQEKKRPSLLASLAKFNELMKSQPKPEKNKDRGGHEL